MVVAFVLMIWWELRQLRVGHRPIVNLTLFKRPNFSIGFILMFVLGFSLYGTTVLIPQFVQTLLGYTAELAGMVLSPAGLMMMAMMPVVGILSSKVDPRKLMFYGFFMLTTSLIVMHTMDLGISYRTARLPAHLPGFGACLPLHPDQHDRVHRREAVGEQRRLRPYEPCP